MSEVLTFPASTTAHLINKYHIHATPENRTTLDKRAQRDTLFFAFRGPNGGYIEKLFKRKLIAVISLDPTEDIAKQLATQQVVLPADWLKIINGFIEGLRTLPRLRDREQYAKRQWFHLLNYGGDNDSLPHRPRPAVNTPGPIGYSETEVRAGSPVLARRR